MIARTFFILLFTISGYCQHYEKPVNVSRQINHFETSAFELFATDIMYGSPTESGIRMPKHRIESFHDQFFKVFNVESGSLLDSYADDERILYSKYGELWASNYQTSSGHNIIKGYTAEGVVEYHRSEIFDEGEMLFLGEINDQYITIESYQTLSCYSICGELAWSYKYPYGNLYPEEVFLTSDESILVINKPDFQVVALDMSSGDQLWKYDGEYFSRPIRYAPSSDVLLFDNSQLKAGVINRNGTQLFEIDAIKDLRSESFIKGRRLVNENIVIPNLKYEERRIKLPRKLASNGGSPVTPISWSTDGEYYAIVYSFQERSELSDSTTERYRIDIVSSDGNEMGYFYPRIRVKLDQAKINVQVSNDGDEILFIGRQVGGPQFYCRRYRISL